MKINIKKEIEQLKDLIQTVVDLQDQNQYKDHSGIQAIQALKALHKAEILDIQLSYPSAAAKDIVDTDIELAKDLHTYLGHFLQDKEAA